MQNKPKLKDVPCADLSAAAENRLTMAALTVGGYVLEPSLEDVLEAAAVLLNLADTMLESEPHNIIYDHIPRA